MLIKLQNFFPKLVPKSNTAVAVQCRSRMRPSQLLASPVFWAAVADIKSLLSGEPLLPFHERPTEQRSYILNNAGHPPLVEGTRGWMSHFYDSREQVQSSPLETTGIKASAGIRSAVARVAAFHLGSQAAVDARKTKMASLQRVANTLTGLNTAMRAALHFRVPVQMAT